MILTNRITYLPKAKASNGLERASKRLKKKACIVFASISQPVVFLLAATKGQFDALQEAFSHLQSATPDTNQVRLIYSSLLVRAFLSPKHCMVSWLLTEIQFEAFAASTKDRTWAALKDFELASSGSEEARLALYQERLSRVF